MRNVIPKAKGGIVVDGLDGLSIKFPKCCSPIKGEPILGYISRGQGVTVHRADCPRVLDYDPARRVEVQWDSESRQARPIHIQIYSGDVPGLLANIDPVLHNAGVNITAVNCRIVDHDRAVNDFTVMIQDLEQLKRVLERIERVKGVRGVERLDDDML